MGAYLCGPCAAEARYAAEVGLSGAVFGLLQMYRVQPTLQHKVVAAHGGAPQAMAGPMHHESTAKVLGAVHTGCSNSTIGSKLASSNNLAGPMM